MQQPRDLPGWHRQERDLRVPGKGPVGLGWGAVEGLH